MSENLFPISHELHEDESGLGFCLRSVSANGGQLLALRHLLGIGPSARIQAMHAVKLSQWFGVEKALLEHRLPVFLPRVGGARRFCYGHFFRQPGALRLTQPQLCPQCISEKGYLQGVWDLTLSTCCLEHGLLLVGRCPQCQSVIKWERKGVQWGACRHHLGLSRNAAVADSSLLSAQRILQASFRSQGGPAMAMNECLPTWIAGLSVDGWMHVLYAFGLLRAAWAPLCSKELSQCSASVDAQEIVSRGIRRIRDFEVGSPRHSEWSAVVARIPLINLMICPTGLQDQAIGYQLFQRIFGCSELNDVVRKHPQLGQLELFGELFI